MQLDFTLIHRKSIAFHRICDMFRRDGAKQLSTLADLCFHDNLFIFQPSREILRFLELLRLMPGNFVVLGLKAV